MTGTGLNPEEIVRRLAAGENLVSVAVSTLGSPSREALKRCASVPVFDPPLYDAHLRGAGGPSLQELLDVDQITRVPGSDSLFGIAPVLRDDAWDRWWTDEGDRPGSNAVPAGLQAVSRELAEHYRHADVPLEQLRQLVLVDPERAKELFEVLYRAADERFDLAGCQDVIDVLADPDRTHLLPFELAQLRDDYQVHLDARSLWAPEFHQSARYLSRPRLEAPLRDMLRDDGPRTVQLCARGGMGKTMQLRWFISRHCLARQRPVPCARIDFDAVDPVNAAVMPWLLLLEAAYQLNRQMVGAPFLELLRDHGAYRGALREDAPASEAESVDRSTTVDEDAADVTRRFVRALNEVRGDAPVVVVLDTLEQLVTHQAGNLDRLLALLGQVQEAASSIRLVLSGRNDLRGPGVGLERHFPDAVSVAVEEFDAEEAQRYLADVRGIAAPAVVSAIVRKSDGLPFTLAMFGDLARGPGGLTAQEVEQSTGPALLYCIDRVLERINDDRVRWLLRYGVVPRVLSLEFVLRVAWPYLVEGVRGDGVHDDPALDGRPPRETEIFLRGVDPPPTRGSDVRALWEQLTGYASASSWVSFTGPEPDTVIIHPTVRAPLRALVRAHPVYRELHRGALDYYRSRALADPDRWARWIREAVYHRLHLDADVGGQEWRAAVDRAWRAGHDDWVELLASDLFAPEYGDEEGPDGMVPSRMRYEASIELARVVAERARAEGLTSRHPMWSVVDGRLGEADRLLRSLATPVAVNRHHIVRATLLMARAQPAGAEEVLAAVDWASMSEADRRDALLIHAEAAAAAGRRGAAEEAYSAAYEESLRLGDAQGAVDIAVAASDRHLQVDEIGQAHGWLRAAERVGPVDATGTSGQAAAALLRSGQPAAALHRLVGYSSPELARLRAEALLTLRRPAAALAALAEAAPAADVAGGVAALLLRARIGAALMRVDEAHDDVARAAQLAGRDPELRTVCAVTGALVQLRAVGNLRKAEKNMEEADRFRAAVGGDGWLDSRLAKAELLDARGQGPAAHDELRRTLDSLGSAASRRQGTRVAVRGLCIRTDPRPSAYLPLLEDNLRRLHAPSACVPLLAELDGCPGLGDTDTALRDSLRRMVTDARLDGDLERDDQAHMGLVAVEVYRLVDDTDEATAVLAEAVAVLADNDPIVWWDWLRASDRICPAPPAEHIPPPALVDRYADDPMLCAAYLIDLTERRLGLDPVWQSESRLTEAERLLTADPTHATRCHARLKDVWCALNLRRGDRDKGHRDAAAAAAVWSELGDSLAHERSLGRIPESLVTVQARPRTEVVIRLDLGDSGQVSVETVLAGQSGRGEFLPAPRWLNGQLTDPLADPGMLEALRSSLSDRGWTAGGGLLGSAAGEMLEHARPDGSLDVRFEIGTAALAALPWELVQLADRLLVHHQAVRHVYRAPDAGETARTETLQLQRALRRLGVDAGPVDGLHGPATMAGLRDFQHGLGMAASGAPGRATWRAIRKALRGQAGGRPVRVLLLAPSLRSAIMTQRGVKGSQAEAEAIYRGVGFEVTVVDNPSWAQIAEPAEQAVRRGQPPDILHVSAVIERSAGVALLDFPGSATPLSATALDDLVSMLTVEIAPLVILDVAAPAGRSELVRQLVLRNDFAHGLAALGHAWVILGVGLDPGRAAQLQYQTLATGFARHRNAVEVCHDLRRDPKAPRPEWGEALPAAGAMLLSSVSPDALLEPGLW